MKSALTILTHLLQLEFLAGYRTYVAAAGLVALGVYQFTQGQVEPAAQSILAGLAAFGVRRAMPDGATAPPSP